mgnify:CR=1 FL=1
MPDDKDRTDEVPEPAEDLGLPTPPSPGRIPPPHLPPPPRGQRIPDEAVSRRSVLTCGAAGGQPQPSMHGDPSQGGRWRHPGCCDPGCGDLDPWAAARRHAMRPDRAAGVSAR